jgi:CheY-like chemotaxis protein
MKPYVLVIDDNIDTRCMVQYFLREDFDVVTVSNAETVLNLLHRFRPDVIVTDLAMPTLDGLNFIKAMKQLKGCNDIPVIVLSGFANFFYDEATAAGADLVLQKPEGTLTLANTIKQLLAK